MRTRAPLVALSTFALGAVLLSGAEDTPAPGIAEHFFSVRTYGVKGDGVTMDTAAINAAVDTSAKAGGGVVWFPPGKYLSGTIHLRSHTHLSLALGAVLIGTTNLADYQQPQVPSFMPEARWGKWHRALLLGQDVEDVTISGPGTINGNKVFDPTGEERMRGPHTVVFVNCRNFVFRDLTIVDSANYAIFFQASDGVEVNNVKFVGGWDGVHFRGAPARWCRDVKIINSQFFTGDDSIAGRYWDNTLISGCIINSSCNGIRLIGPATRLIVNDCLFYGPGLQPHRSSARTNMLSGIILQPGAWDKTEGLLDDVLLANNTMHNVASPVTVWTRAGNTAGRITISGLNATGVYRSAISFESWAETPITNVLLRNAFVQTAGGAKVADRTQIVKGPGVDARPLPAWGIYARNVETLTVQDSRFDLTRDDARPFARAESVTRLDLEQVHFPEFPDVAESIVTTNVGKMKRTGKSRTSE